MEICTCLICPGCGGERSELIEERIIRDYLRHLENMPAPTLYTKGKIFACHLILRRHRKGD